MRPDPIGADAPPTTTPASAAPVRTATLSALAAAVGGTVDGGDAVITGLAHDSRRVAPGDLFVALPGTRDDGAAHVTDAVRRGAAAACVALTAARPATSDVPLLTVADPHAALAALAAAFHGHPASALRLIGITGTLGKTSTALLVQSALATSGDGVGVIGSLGARVRGPAAARIPTGAIPDLGGMTTPDAPVLHATLRAMVDAGVRTVAIEVTSHALTQRRAQGLAFTIGVLTNLVPDEHLEYHPSPEHYLATKARFLDLLLPDAPVVANADDARVVAMLDAAVARHPRTIVGVSLGDAARVLSGRPDGRAAVDPGVCVEELRADVGGSTFVLRVRRPIPCLTAAGWGELPACVVPVVLPVLGLQQVANAALAATAALVAGATPMGITEALAGMEPMRRRMEVVREAAPLVIDDTAGNPETLRAVFATVSDVPRATLRVLFGVRGMRGTEINRRLAATIAELVRALPCEGVELVVTASDDTAGPRDRVQPDEHAVVRDTLAAAHVDHTFEPRLADAVRHLARRTRADDLVLLLGAQGMDQAAALLLRALARVPTATGHTDEG